jgi:hypothetical protein
MLGFFLLTPAVGAAGAVEADSGEPCGLYCLRSEK